MIDANALDAAALGPYLEQHVPGFAGIEAIEKFSAGQSNPTYLIKAESGRYVLRAKPAGHLLKSAHMVDREFRVMKALAGSGVPVPNVLYLSGEDTPIGRMFYVMAFLDGRIFWDPALPEILDNAGRAAIYDAMNATLAALAWSRRRPRRPDRFRQAGQLFRTPVRPLDQPVPRLRDRGRSRYGKADRLARRQHAGRRWPGFPGAWRFPAGQHDLRQGCAERDRRARLGIVDARPSLRRSRLPVHAMAAAACHRLPQLSAVSAASIGQRSACLRSATTSSAIASGAASTRVGNWTFYLAFSFFRFAAICQGVYRRALDGNASNPEKAQLYGDVVRLLAGLAVELLDAEG